MLPILLCLCAWGWSRSHLILVEYCHHGRFVACTSLWGTIGVKWGIDTGEPDGWLCRTVLQLQAHFWPVDFFWGFRYFHGRITTQTLHLLKAPWWFLIVVFSLILYVVWRKTRPRGPGRAFPVELTAPQSEPSGKTQ